ncbi:MAG TPA: T9SS type A sorting domain-containing protein, partial [Patescibacteria group bacterium]|nr:T9SS type A sorting domain-containing protein [Patescibacteria group bacterium]
FIISCDFYNDVHFTLYDALSRQVISISLMADTTVLNRNNLPNGVYLWRITKGNDVTKTGKLIIE